MVCHCHQIKKLDLFALPLQTFFTSRNKKTNKKSFRLFHGSVAGVILTIMFSLCLLGYTVALSAQLVFHEDDYQKLNVLVNDYQGEFQREYMGNNSFVPSLAVEVVNLELLKKRNFNLLEGEE